MKKTLYIAADCISLALGCIGVVLPILPTVPFLMITLYCFTRSSERLRSWFVGTKLYRNHLETFVKRKA